MPSLTIELIRDNPWNTVTHALPPHPSPVLIELARLAAAYCRDSEYLLMMAAREGDYTPPDWKPEDDYPDVHEESEGRCLEADRVLSEICRHYENCTDET